MGATLGALLAAAAAVALVAAWRARGEAGRLHRRLEAAAGELQHLQTSFARFAPRQVVERIVARGISTEADRVEITVLFADLVGFTALGEALAPEALVRVLNGYFARMSRVIEDHRGHVAKFIGDGLMALFGALEPNPWHTNDALHAALALRAALEAYNAELSAAGLPRLRFGVGVHRGPVVAGVIGSPELMEFTVVGHTVNVAARVEALTREHGVDVLVTDAVRDASDRAFVMRPLRPVVVKGVGEPVATFALEAYGPAEH